MFPMSVVLKRRGGAMLNVEKEEEVAKAVDGREIV